MSGEWLTAYLAVGVLVVGTSVAFVAAAHADGNEDARKWWARSVLAAPVWPLTLALGVLAAVVWLVMVAFEPERGWF